MPSFILKINIFLILFSLTITGVFAEKVVTRNEVFTYFGESLSQNIPESYLYIDVKYRGLEQYPQLKKALQVLIYTDKIKNNGVKFFPEAGLSQYDFLILSEKILGVKYNITGYEKLKNTPLSESNFSSLKKYIQTQKENQTSNNELNIIIPSAAGIGAKSDIFFDVYKTLEREHYNAKDFERDTLIQGAIKGLTESTNDTYTSYFPPVQSQNFLENLEGEYEGIGAYVDLPEPGVFIIVTPMVGSPAEKAGLKGGDKVLRVGEKTIGRDNTSSEIVSWIKGPAGTQVTLEIFRPSTKETFEVQVIREKIIIEDIEHKVLDIKTYYIQIKNFGEKVDTDFDRALKAFKNSGKEKLIIDLRNNPGGYLDKVANMLSHFVATGEPVAVIKNKTYTQNYTANDTEKYDISDKKIFILQNAGSASASEIMIGTLKDYYPQIQTVGEKTFGKGSVQTLKKYYDGSVLKYTTARWYTGKSQTAIDGIGIAPDIEIIEDKETEKDEVLEYVLQK